MVVAERNDVAAEIDLLHVFGQIVVGNEGRYTDFVRREGDGEDVARGFHARHVEVALVEVIAEPVVFEHFDVGAQRYEVFVGIHLVHFEETAVGRVVHIPFSVGVGVVPGVSAQIDVALEQVAVDADAGDALCVEHHFEECAEGIVAAVAVVVVSGVLDHEVLQRFELLQVVFAVLGHLVGLGFHLRELFGGERRGIFFL